MTAKAVGKKKIKILTDDKRMKHSQSVSRPESSFSAGSKKSNRVNPTSPKYFQTLVPGTGGNPVGGAKVRVEERAKDHVASSRGEYWRLLTPGDC